ncbi:MAG: rhodanese-like domain-containing protein [Candidatus Helarchaeota archaeon]|nr:rhodanese-like domain-containing protein [Candidatus Helarchaeota archaeon]
MSPLNEIRKTAIELKEENIKGANYIVMIVTNSLDFNCPASGIAAERLKDYGFNKVLRYKGGWQEWKDSIYPTE